MTTRATFDWLTFCVRRGIEFIRSGKNVSGNHIAVKCPLCGPADPSQHMVLSLDRNSPYWYCWRNSAHRGRNPTFLIARLGRISLAAARSMVDEGVGVMDAEWNEVVNRLMIGPPKPEGLQVRSISLPKQVSRLTLKVTNGPFFDYLAYRGFDHLANLVRDVELYCSFVGWFAYRLIFPVYHDGKLVNLIGRDITNKQQLRYKTMPKGKAGLDIDQTVYNHDDALLGGGVLWVCEGPVDALKLNWYSDADDSAVALFGMPKGAQLAVLNRLGRWFDSTSLVLDSDSMGKAMRLQHELHGRVITSWLPQGIKDVGAMGPRDVRKFCRSQKRLLTRGTDNLNSGPARTQERLPVWAATKTE